MENNKLIQVKEGIFSKVFRKIKLLFFRSKRTEELKEEKTEEKSKKIDINFRETLKVAIEDDKEYQKELFLKKIHKNPSLLENFSIETLKKIKRYYEEGIKRKKRILK